MLLAEEKDGEEWEKKKEGEKEEEEKKKANLELNGQQLRIHFEIT